ncbi:MAG: M48 family metallopeptidase [Rhodospirillales bacterium]
MSVHGDLFAAGAARLTPATLGARDGMAWLATDGREEAVAVAAASDRLSGVARRIALADGRQFVTRDDDGVDALLAALGRRPRGFVARLEGGGARVVAALLVVLALAVAGLRYGLPVAADGAALAAPEWVEHVAGEQTLATLDRIWFEHTALAEDRRKAVSSLMDRLAAVATLPAPPRLEFRRAPGLGPNALALPGGIVVVTDEMVEIAPSDDALGGVLAHEIGHIEGRHALRQVLRAAGWAVVFSLAVGDVGAVTEEAIGVPALLLSRSYSRDFEREADRRAMALMAAAGMDTRALAELWRTLGDACGKGCGRSGWLDTHPGIEERIRAATTP